MEMLHNYFKISILEKEIYISGRPPNGFYFDGLVVCISDNGCNCQGTKIYKFLMQDPPTKHEKNKLKCIAYQKLIPMINKHDKCYIHCEYGQSRSVSILLQYISKTLGINEDQSYNYIISNMIPKRTINPYW